MSKDYKKVKKEKQEEAQKLMTAEQWKKCHAAIHTGAVASFVGGVLPIPVADAIPITAAQLTMVLALANVFGRTITETAAKGLISTAAATMVGRSIFKVFPVIGWGMSGTVASLVTEAMGWAIAVDFAKQAKHPTPISASNTNKEQETASESDNNQLILDSLESRAEPFLSRVKNKYADKEEYDTLINDFEKTLDTIPEHDPLRDIYDKLCLLF